jgi:hypothetical protein
MSEPRNDYGFPLLPAEAVRILWNQPPAPRAPTTLERAQAIAAEVRARRFPPVQRITTKE